MASQLWSDERVNQLKTLWAEDNTSATVIGAAMGISRCAVLGKAHRLGLARRDNRNGMDYGTIRKQCAPRKKPEPRTVTRIIRSNGNSTNLRVTQSVAMEQYKLRCVEIVPLNLTFAEVDLQKQCLYIAGEDSLYCGHPQMSGSSYCTPHHFLCWVKPQPPKHKAFIREAA